MDVLLAVLVAAASLVGVSSTPVACPYPLKVSRSARWPSANRGLAAPVSLTYRYDTYKQPLEAERVEDAINIRIPPDFFAGFNLTDSSRNVQEGYKLRSILIRKPGVVAEGSEQELSHVLETVLLHENVDKNSSTWAAVVLPFSVEVGSSPDMLSALLAGSRLPDRSGEREAVLLGAAQELDLNPSFHNSSFLTYWSTASEKCSSALRPLRLFLRAETQVTSPTTVRAFLNALHGVPDVPAAPAASAAWSTTTCHFASPVCPLAEAADLSAELKEAQALVSTAASKLRAAKSSMDTALVELQNVTHDSYEQAIQARANLKAANAELEGASAHVDQIQAWVDQAKGATWLASPPTDLTSVVSFFSKASSRRPSALLAAARVRRQAAATTVQVAGATSAGNGDCSAFARSPIAIHTQAVAQAQKNWIVATTPLLFDTGDHGAATLQMYNTGNYLRLVAPAGQGSLLGSFKYKGNFLPVVYLDIHVPGEHTIDGDASSAEVQLVHLPASGPAIAVALRLQESGDSTSSHGNAWVSSLLSVLPAANTHVAVQTESVRGLHPALARGDAARFFRYDGTLTRAPCREAEWLVLQEPGTITSHQLSTLRSALPQAPRSSTPFAPSSLVGVGIQELPSAAAATSSSAQLQKGSAQLRRVHTDV